jgi:hypothetical protein
MNDGSRTVKSFAGKGERREMKPPLPEQPITE